MKVEKLIQSKNGITVSADMTVRKAVKYPVCKEDYAWNPSICACECDKHWDSDLSLLYETTIINSMLNIILIPWYYFINDRNQFREIHLKNCALYFFIEIKSMLRKKVDE